MLHSDFKFSSTKVNVNYVNDFQGSEKERKIVTEMIREWNEKICVSDLCLKWYKERPKNNVENLLFVLYNCECLSTHLSDIDIILNTHIPHVIILTGVGSRINNLPHIPNYYWHSQKGTNSFGGVALLIQNSLISKVIERHDNFLLIELQVAQSNLIVGAIYVPPNSRPPFTLFETVKGKEFYLFGDFNAKHTSWSCKSNNTSGNEIRIWLDENGYEGIFPNTPTSRRSDAIIDFGIGHSAEGWTVEVVDIGTSDHFPILYSSPLVVDKTYTYRKSNWKIFSFFLSCVFQYWNACVYNINEQEFFILFSNFLTAVWDRTSVYETFLKYRPPWPPYLVTLAKQVNSIRHKYCRTRFLSYLIEYKQLRNEYRRAKDLYNMEQCEKQVKNLSNQQNIWKIVKPIFRPYLPSFRGLKVNDNEIIKNNQMIADKLGDYFEDHFSKPVHDPENHEHIAYLKTFDEISKLPKLSMEPLEIEEVYKQWLKMSPKKSTDILGTSALLLKYLPVEYLRVITIMFNKCVAKGEFLEAGKVAKIICLSKEGIYPSINKLRPISLLPNLSKLFERCIHTKILKWCESKGIYTDEQSGFSPNRRLQTRIITIGEDIRLTIAAPNRPALGLFVDFATAFDRMWHPALISTLYELEMPLNLIRFIYEWLQNRSMRIQYGEAVSRRINIYVGAPQGSVLAATLFRLHLHFLPKMFLRFNTHLFADDLAILIKGSIEKRLSENIIQLEEHAKIAMSTLEKFSKNILLPINTGKTKAMLFHSAVAPQYPNIYLENQSIEFVSVFKYLGVELRTKLGWGVYIQNRLSKIRNIYCALKKIFKKIPRIDIKNRRLLFLTFALPHFIWIFMLWFFFTEKQRIDIERVYITGLKIIYSLWGWDDHTTMILSREKTINDYLYKYWKKLKIHLDTSNEASAFNETFESYMIITSPDRIKLYYKSMGFRKNSRFPERLVQRAKHTYLELFNFICIHEKQLNYYCTSEDNIKDFICKYLLPP